MYMLFVLGFMLGLVVSMILFFLILTKKNREMLLLEKKLASATTENQKSIEFFNLRIKDLTEIQESMKESFAAISQDTMLKNADMLSLSLKQSMEHFYRSGEQERKLQNKSLADIIGPLKESLSTVDQKISELESSRQGAYSGLKEQIEGLLNSQNALQKETQNLAQCLSSPAIRGRWGEMQLRRVVELSGLSAHCDFLEQQTISNGESQLRPDMIVTLPQNKKIIIDAKAPLEFLDKDRGQELAASLKRHLLTLKKKSYHSMLGKSPEFVVMFLPGEAFLHWALLADPSLIDFAAQNEVVIATPLTLVAILKAVAFGLRQESIANNIEEVRDLSQKLIDRVGKVYEHFDRLGKSLKAANLAYEQTLSSLDSRVLVTARKLSSIKTISGSQDFEQLKANDDLSSVEVSPVEPSGECERTI